MEKRQILWSLGSATEGRAVHKSIGHFAGSNKPQKELLGDGCAAERPQQAGETGAVQQESSSAGTVLVIVGNPYTPAFLTPVCITQQQNTRFRYSHGSWSNPTLGAKDAPRILFGCSRSQLTAAMPIVPSAPSWQTPRSCVVPRAHLLLPFTPFLSPRDNGNSVEDIPGESANILEQINSPSVALWKCPADCLQSYLHWRSSISLWELILIYSYENQV